MSRQQAKPVVVHTVTSAHSDPSDDAPERLRRYLMMMSVRIACFIALPFVQGWLRWACVVAAVVLPYVAVVLANVVSPRQRGIPEAVGTPERVHEALSPAPPAACPADHQDDYQGDYRADPGPTSAQP